MNLPEHLKDAQTVVFQCLRVIWKNKNSDMNFFRDWVKKTYPEYFEWCIKIDTGHVWRQMQPGEPLEEGAVCIVCGRYANSGGAEGCSTASIEDKP